MKPSSSSSTNPHDSPMYVPSGTLDEWFACVSVTLTPSTAIVPPLLIELRPAVVGDAVSSQPPAQLDLRDDGTAEALVDHTVSPRWSPWPCVSRIRSQRSGSRSSSGSSGCR